jgi:hypothetical protein
MREEPKDMIPERMNAEDLNKKNMSLCCTLSGSLCSIHALDHKSPVSSSIVSGVDMF